MKKIFLLFGVAAFSSASAQQKNLLDIQKHLDKMVKNKKFPGVVNRPIEKNSPFFTGFRDPVGNYPIYYPTVTKCIY